MQNASNGRSRGYLGNSVLSDIVLGLLNKKGSIRGCYLLGLTP